MSLPVHAAGTGVDVQHSLSGDIGWRSFGLTKGGVGMVWRALQHGSWGVLDSCEVVECAEKNRDRQRKLLACGLEAGFGVRSGQSDPWVAVETQMFQKKTRPLHVVSVTPAARASTSRLRVSCRELSSSATAPHNPHLLFSKERRGLCAHKPKEEGLELCV